MKIGTKRDILFRLGLGGLFLASSATAWFLSDDFNSLLGANHLTASLGHADTLVKLIGINDALLFLLIVSGKLRKPVAIWGALWILGVIYVTGVTTPDFIEHLAILALLAYYFKTEPAKA